MDAADRPRAAGLARWFFKTPALVYVGPLAWLLATRSILLLETTGRRSGRPRRVTLSFMPLPGRFIVFAGWGERADWYRNILAQPRVVVRIGGRRFAGTAHLVADPSERAALMRQMSARSADIGPPVFARPLLRALRLFDYDAEIARAVSFDGALPVVELVARTD